jgi:hypothetical protein
MNGPYGPPVWFRQSKLAPITIAAKVPHLACQIPVPQAETLIALAEHDPSIQEPMNARPTDRFGSLWQDHALRSELMFLPLDFRPGEVGRKLTFIAQKSRVAEFFVRASPEARRLR